MVFSLSIAVSAAETKLNKNDSWVITTSSQMNDGFMSVKNAFDGDIATYWHTVYTFQGTEVTGHEEPPHDIMVDFGKTVKVSGWRYTPRQDNATGTFLKYNIYASKDGKTFNLIYSGDFPYKGGTKDQPAEKASWGDVEMRAIIIRGVETINGYGTAAEIEFFTGGTGTSVKNGDKYSGKLVAGSGSSSAGTGNTGNTGSAGGKDKGSATVSGTAIKNDGTWKFTASSDVNTSVVNAFDGDTKSYWHTAYKTNEEGTEVVSHDECPHTIDIDFGKEMTISGWLYTPRQDNGAGTFLNYNMYKSNDGKKYEKFFTGSFEYKGGNDVTRDPKGASWGNQKMKYLRIEVTNSISGYGTAAEITFYTGGTGKPNASGTIENGKDTSKPDVSDRTAADGTPFYDKAGWKAEVNSEKGSNVSKIFDGDVTTYWHSDYTADGPTVTGHDNPPYHLKVTLPKAVLTSGIVLTPRQDNPNGRILGADIYVSDTDDGEWFLLKEGMEFANTTIAKEIAFTANLNIKRVWVEVTTGNGGYGTLAEFDLMVKKDSFETVKFTDYAANEEKNALYEIPRNQISAEFAGENWAKNIPQNMFDGSEQTFWQTEGIAAMDWPAVLTVDLKSIYKLKEIRMLPRQSADCHGTWLKLTVSGSTDDENWFIIKEGIEFNKDILMKTITFDEETNVRYLEFQIEDGFASRASCAEMTFWQTKTAKDEFVEMNSRKYILKIGSNTIESDKGGVKSSKEIDVAPYIVNGSTMIPLRGLLEEMGASIEWNGADETIKVNNGSNIIKLQIWNYLVYVYGTQYGDLRYTLLNPPIIKDSRTFIPVRFVSEQLGYNVDWDAATQTITITK